MRPSARQRDHEPCGWLAWTALLTTAIGAAFWGAGLHRTGGRFPVPLDDVFIHFGFARSAALGHPFSWIPGNGYSSGGTSLTYPLVLAFGWWMGFRGEHLAVFAAVLACACVVDLARSLRRLLDPVPRWLTWAIPPLVLAVPLLDWSLFSGMETAFFAAVLGRALMAAREAERSSPQARAIAQWRAGLWAACLVATRPESTPLAYLVGLAVVHAAGALATVPALVRAIGPTSVWLVGQALLNRALTGEWSAAGAVRKLVTENPYASALDMAMEVIKNLAALRSQVFDAALGGGLVSWLLPGLGLVGMLDRRSRRVAVALLLGAVAASGLVAFNSTARFQNFRYAAPSLLMMIAAAAVGAGVLVRWGRAFELIGAGLIAAAIVAPRSSFRRQIDHFARASRNIAEQQVEVARRLEARLPRPRRVLVGDAGAIPYLSALDALDGLGLGGYHALPFARASVHGVPGVVELIERLSPGERPDVLALYPSWWPGLADVFGRRVDAVRIEDNVICGADEKVIYEADWSALATPNDVREGQIDAVDVADLIDERAHGYVFPGPRGGWMISAVLALPGGQKRFDAGRILPEGRRESFTVHAADGRAAALLLRTDGGGEGQIRVAVERTGRTVMEREAALPLRDADRWHEVRVSLGGVERGDRIHIHAVRAAFRDFHAWLVHAKGNAE